MLGNSNKLKKNALLQKLSSLASDASSTDPPVDGTVPDDEDSDDSLEAESPRKIRDPWQMSFISKKFNEARPWFVSVDFRLDRDPSQLRIGVLNRRLLRVYKILAEAFDSNIYGISMVDDRLGKEYPVSNDFQWTSMVERIEAEQGFKESNPSQLFTRVSELLKKQKDGNHRIGIDIIATIQQFGKMLHSRAWGKGCRAEVIERVNGMVQQRHRERKAAEARRLAENDENLARKRAEEKAQKEKAKAKGKKSDKKQRKKKNKHKKQEEKTDLDSHGVKDETPLPELHTEGEINAVAKSLWNEGMQHEWLLLKGACSCLHQVTAFATACLQDIGTLMAAALQRGKPAPAASEGKRGRHGKHSQADLHQDPPKSEAAPSRTMCTEYVPSPRIWRHWRPGMVPASILGDPTRTKEWAAKLKARRIQARLRQTISPSHVGTIMQEYSHVLQQEIQAVDTSNVHSMDGDDGVWRKNGLLCFGVPEALIYPATGQRLAWEMAHAACLFDALLAATECIAEWTSAFTRFTAASDAGAPVVEEIGADEEGYPTYSWTAPREGAGTEDSSRLSDTLEGLGVHSLIAHGGYTVLYLTDTVMECLKSDRPYKKRLLPCHASFFARASGMLGGSLSALATYLLRAKGSQTVIMKYASLALFHILEAATAIPAIEHETEEYIVRAQAEEKRRRRSRIRLQATGSTDHQSASDPIAIEFRTWSDQQVTHAAGMATRYTAKYDSWNWWSGAPSTAQAESSSQAAGGSGSDNATVLLTCEEVCMQALSLFFTVGPNILLDTLLVNPHARAAFSRAAIHGPAVVKLMAAAILTGCCGIQKDGVLVLLDNGVSNALNNFAQWSQETKAKLKGDSESVQGHVGVLVSPRARSTMKALAEDEEASKFTFNVPPERVQGQDDPLEELEYTDGSDYPAPPTYTKSYETPQRLSRMQGSMEEMLGLLSWAHSEAYYAHRSREKVANWWWTALQQRGRLSRYTRGTMPPAAGEPSSRGTRALRSECEAYVQQTYWLGVVPPWGLFRERPVAAWEALQEGHLPNIERWREQKAAVNEQWKQVRRFKRVADVLHPMASQGEEEEEPEYIEKYDEDERGRFLKYYEKQHSQVAAPRSRPVTSTLSTMPSRSARQRLAEKMETVSTHQSEASSKAPTASNASFFEDYSIDEHSVESDPHQLLTVALAQHRDDYFVSGGFLKSLGLEYEVDAHERFVSILSALLADGRDQERLIAVTGSIAVLTCLPSFARRLPRSNLWDPILRTLKVAEPGSALFLQCTIAVAFTLEHNGDSTHLDHELVSRGIGKKLLKSIPMLVDMEEEDGRTPGSAAKGSRRPSVVSVASVVDDNTAKDNTALLTIQAVTYCLSKLGRVMEDTGQEDILTITSLLGLSDLVTLRQAIMTLWSLISHPGSRKTADAQVLLVTMEMSISLARHLWPKRCTVLPLHGAEGMSSRMESAGIARGASFSEVDPLTHRRAMYPFVLGCLWQLCFNPLHRDALMTDDRYMQHLLEMLTIEDATARKYQQIIVGVMWTLVESRGQRFDIKATGLPKWVYKLAASPLSTEAVALYCLRLLHYLYTQPHTQQATKLVLQETLGDAVYEQLLVRFIQLEHSALERFSSAFLLSLSGEVAVREMLGRTGAIAQIAAALHNKSDPDVAKLLLLLLLNLSALYDNRAEIGKHAMPTLFAFFTSAPSHDLQLIAAQVISNLEKHPANRTRIYSEELKARNQEHKTALRLYNMFADAPVEEDEPEETSLPALQSTKQGAHARSSRARPATSAAASRKIRSLNSRLCRPRAEIPLCFASLTVAANITLPSFETTSVPEPQPPSSAMEGGSIEIMPSLDTVEGAVGVVREGSLGDGMDSLHYQVYEDPLASNLPRFPKLVPIASSLVDTGTGRFDLHIARTVESQTIGPAGAEGTRSSMRPSTALQPSGMGRTPVPPSPIRPSRPNTTNIRTRSPRVGATYSALDSQTMNASMAVSVDAVPLSSSLFQTDGEQTPSTTMMQASDVVRLRWNPPVQIDAAGRVSPRVSAEQPSPLSKSTQQDSGPFGVSIVSSNRTSPRALTRFRSFRDTTQAASASSHAVKRLGKPLLDVHDKMSSIRSRALALTREMEILDTEVADWPIPGKASNNTEDTGGKRVSAFLHTLTLPGAQRPSKQQRYRSLEAKRDLKKRVRADGGTSLVKFGKWEVRNGRVRQVPVAKEGDTSSIPEPEPVPASSVNKTRPSPRHKHLTERPATSPVHSGGVATFKYVPGSTIGEALFPKYTLPDGREVHVYYKDEIHEAVFYAENIPPQPPKVTSDLFIDEQYPPPPTPTMSPFTTRGRVGEFKLNYLIPFITLQSCTNPLPFSRFHFKILTYRPNLVIEPGEEKNFEIVESKDPYGRVVDYRKRRKVLAWSKETSIWGRRKKEWECQGLVHTIEFNTKCLDHDWSVLLSRPRTVRFVQHSARRVARRVAESQGRAARRMEMLQHLQGRNLKTGDFVGEAEEEGGKNYVSVSQQGADGSIDEKAVLQAELERLYDILRVRYDMVLSLFEEYSSAMPDEGDPSLRKSTRTRKARMVQHLDPKDLMSSIDRINLFAFYEFCDATGIREETGTTLTTRALETMFQTTTFQDDKAGDRTALTLLGLNRPQWLEILLRVAEAKYLRNGYVRNLSDAVACLLDNHVKPLPRRIRKGADCYRQSRLYRKNVSEYLQNHKVALLKIFRKLSVRIREEGKALRLVDTSTWLKNLTRAGVLKSPLSDADALTVFGLSRQRVVAPEVTKARATMLTFTGFLESLVRLSDLLAVLREKGRGRTSTGALILPDLLSDDEGSDDEGSAKTPLRSATDHSEGPIRSDSTQTTALHYWIASCSLIRTDMVTRRKVLGEVINDFLVSQGFSPEDED